MSIQEAELIVIASVASASCAWVFGYWVGLRMASKIWRPLFDDFAAELMAQNRKAWKRVHDELKYGPDKDVGDK